MMYSLCLHVFCLGHASLPITWAIPGIRGLRCLLEVFETTSNTPVLGGRSLSKQPRQKQQQTEPKDQKTTNKSNKRKNKQKKQKQTKQPKKESKHHLKLWAQAVIRLSDCGNIAPTNTANGPVGELNVEGKSVDKLTLQAGDSSFLMFLFVIRDFKKTKAKKVNGFYMFLPKGK